MERSRTHVVRLLSVALLLASSCTGRIEEIGPGTTGSMVPPPGGTGTPGGTGSGGAPPPPGVLQSSFARLTRAEYRAAITHAFGVDADVSAVPEDGRVGPYTSNVGQGSDPVQPFLLSSEDLAATIVPGKLPVCAAASARTCITNSYQNPFERLFRRPVSSTEIGTWSTMLANLEKAGLTAEAATRAMVTSALLQPDALFRATPLTGDVARARRLTEHLSYALWDAPPDTELAGLSSASSAMDLGARLRAQADRLGRDARAVPVLARFVAQWLHVDVDLKVAADAAYATSPLYLELLAFVQDALATGVPVTSLVSGTRGFVHKSNLAPYGLTSATGTGTVVPVTWAASSPRRGVVGQEAIVDPTRHPDLSRRAIFRGALVRRSLLCQNIPAPSAELIALAGEVTDRTKDARCSGCHLLLDPIGAGFVALDRDFTGTAPPVQVNDHPELAGAYPQLTSFLETLAGSRSFAECFARQIWSFFLEQPPIEVDAASIAEIAAVVQRGGSLIDVLGQMAASLEMRSRSVVPWCQGS